MKGIGIKDGCGHGRDSLRSRLNYEPQMLGFGTSGRRGKVVDLTQLEVYLNALAELEYLQSLPPRRAVSGGATILFCL